jgi:hypothetical protein
MPLKRVLGASRNFHPDSVAILLEAYNGLVAELGLRTAAEKERAAGIILRLAQAQTELDVTKLRDAAADAMLNEGVPKRHS